MGGVVFDVVYRETVWWRKENPVYAFRLERQLTCVAYDHLGTAKFDAERINRSTSLLYDENVPLEDALELLFQCLTRTAFGESERIKISEQKQRPHIGFEPVGIQRLRPLGGSIVYRI